MIDFVGAGPGACDLISVRGMHLIENADVIIYTGSLVNPELLSYAKKDPEIYDSAKMTLEEVMEVILKADAKEQSVVRLHTGEPSLYGAIREQMDLLDQKNVAYRCCPGISACFGAAASLNLEYTLPGVTQTLIITRMEGKTPVPQKEKIETLAAHRASMAIYLSAGMIDELTRRLIDGGYPEDTPAAIVYKATFPDEKIILCKLKDAPEACVEQKITKTAVILVGDAILHERFERSKLYDPTFTTGYREGMKEGV